MKFAKLFMAIAVVCLAVACDGNNKSEEAKAALVDPQEQIEIATKAIEEHKYLDAAQAVSKIDAVYMAQEAQKISDIAIQASGIVMAINLSDNAEAREIAGNWNDAIRAEVEKLETQ